MELLVTLSKITNIEELKKSGATGIIVGTSLFSSRYHYSLNDLVKIKEKTLELGLDLFITIDTMVEEKDIVLLKDYLELLNKMGVKGIYFTDLSVYAYAKQMQIVDSLIYDPTTLMTNSVDANFYLAKGIDSIVAAREITLDEILGMSKHVDKLEMQIAGYLKSATSKRKFLTNYFDYLKQDYNPTNRMDLKIVEETRDYALPILENNYGTQIYTDYVLLALKEFPKLSQFLKRAIIDDIFLDEIDTFKIVRAFNEVNETNAEALYQQLVAECPKCHFDTGYLYQKTNLTK